MRKENFIKKYIGKKYGRMTVVDVLFNKTRNKLVCLCDCGSKTSCIVSNAVSGHTSSCGCIRSEIRRNDFIKRSSKLKRNTTHGMTNSIEFRTWTSMLGRCYNVKNSSYKRYGERGVTVCDRWKKSFEAFHNDMGNRPSEDHSIDRINNDGDYCPDNCRWATRKEQQRNRSVTKRYIFNNELLTIGEICENTGRSRHSVTKEVRSKK